MRFSSSATAALGRNAIQPPTARTATATAANSRLRGRRSTCRNVAIGDVTAMEPLGVAMPSRACRMSLAPCGRSAGFLARQAITSSASTGESAGRRSVIGTTGSVTCAASIWCGAIPSNGARPVSISYAIAPNA